MKILMWEFRWSKNVVGPNTKVEKKKPSCFDISIQVEPKFLKKNYFPNLIYYIYMFIFYYFF
jgi:hypothetical protein